MRFYVMNWMADGIACSGRGGSVARRMNRKYVVTIVLDSSRYEMISSFYFGYSVLGVCVYASNLYVP